MSGESIWRMFPEIREAHPLAHGAWAWGTMRVRDLLETLVEVDQDRVAIVGHSRMAKSAVIVGAYDTRFALVCANGARIEESPDGNTLLENCLAEEISRKVCEIMMASGVYFVCYARGVNYHANADAPRRGQMPGAAPGRFTVRHVLDREALLREGVRRPYKYVAFTEDMQALARLREALEGAGLPVNISSSWFDNLEVMTETANKGGALRFLAERYDIPREEIMAFGDERNDLEMIRFAGWGVAMGNASGEIRRAARLVAPSNDEDGVAAILEESVLKDGNTP